MVGMSDFQTAARWGTIHEGKFRVIPRQPMELGGYGPPPFDVTRPDGVILHIVEEPGE